MLVNKKSFGAIPAYLKQSNLYIPPKSIGVRTYSLDPNVTKILTAAIANKSNPVAFRPQLFNRQGIVNANNTTSTTQSTSTTVSPETKKTAEEVSKDLNTTSTTSSVSNSTTTPTTPTNNADLTLGPGDAKVLDDANKLLASTKSSIKDKWNNLTPAKRGMMIIGSILIAYFTYRYLFKGGRSDGGYKS